jgi:rare lipoprotein A (peptidoglycan hydrolase)
MANFWSRALIGASLAGVLASCSSVPDQQSQTNSPEAALAAALAVAEPVPQFEPPSRSGNPDTYVVFGRRYRVKDSSEGYRETGVASWYGWDFHGRKTSSGPLFNMFELTAAHKSLPIPTYARVTNLENGHSIVVKVTDRGPFVDDRAIDLSYAAAARLDMLEQGTAQVEIVALAPYQYLPNLAARRSEQRERVASLALRREEVRERRLANLALRREQAATIEFAHEAPVAGRSSSRLAMANVIRNPVPTKNRPIVASAGKGKAAKGVAVAPPAKGKSKSVERVAVVAPPAKGKSKVAERAVVTAPPAKGKAKAAERAVVAAPVGKGKVADRTVAAAPTAKSQPLVRVASARNGRSRFAAD